jgi:uncharacterized protein (TIGR00251 family)
MDAAMSAKVSVRVHPRARRSRIAGMLGAAIKLDIAAPANDGKANEECFALLADVTGVPKSRIRLLVGAHNPSKVIAFDGISQEELDLKLKAAL